MERREQFCFGMLGLRNGWGLLHSDKGPPCLKQVSCFPSQVQRQVYDPPIPAVPPFGEAQGVLRLALGDVPIEGGEGLVLPALGLNRDDFRPILQHEVGLAVFVGVIPGPHLKLAPQLLQNVILCQQPP